MSCRAAFVILACCWLPATVAAQETPPVIEHEDSLITVRMVDVELRAAVQALSRYLGKPLVATGLGNAGVTLETPAPITRDRIPELVRALLESHGFELLEEEQLYRVRSVEPERRGTREPVSGPSPAGDLRLYVIHLKHARSPDVAATVSALFGIASALGERGAPPGTLTEGLRDARVPPIDSEQEAVPGLVSGQAVLGGEIAVVPDPRTNSLLVRATERDFQIIRSAVQEIDARPLQVLTEVLIVEVRKDRSFSFGLEATLPPTPVGGSTDTRVDASTTGLGLADFVLRVMGIGGVDLDLTLRAAAARGDVSIVSRPVLLTANNETAEILVGSQRPFVQVQRALPTEAPVRDQVIQYRDVGTQLTVRPTISDDGYVMLHVTQEVNAATSETAFDAPVISTRSIQTQLLVRDGQTAVLGGLSDRQRDASQGGVPILSSIPLLGGLFGRASRRATETELFVFLTPHVIQDDDDLDDTTTRFGKEMDELQPSKELRSDRRKPPREHR